MNYLTIPNCCNIAPVIGNALLLLAYDGPSFARYRANLEKTIYFLTSSIFLQIGSQSLGYMAAMAWCGLTVNPILVTAAYSVTITTIFLTVTDIDHNRLKHQILKQQIIRAVFTFACSFFLNLILNKYFVGFEIAEAIASKNVNDSMKTISQNITAIFQQTVPHSLLTKQLILSLTNGAKSILYIKNMSILGYRESSIIYIAGGLMTFPFLIFWDNARVNSQNSRAL